MSKHRFLKVVGFFVVVAAVLAFLALPDSQAAKGKPIKWQATVTGENLWSPNVFVGGQDSVNIVNGVGSNTTPCNTNGTGAYSYLELQVYNPSLLFNMGGFTSSGNAAPAPYGLPNTSSPWPQSIADFLNGPPHPTADYQHVFLRFTTCGCGLPITDLMAMGEGEILPVHMKLLFFSHIWDCPANSPFSQQTYLNLHMNAHGFAGAILPDVNGSTYDVYIKRVGDTWTAYVNTVFNNPAYVASVDDVTSANWPVTIADNILGQYAVCSSTTNKRGRTTWTTTYHYPWAKAPLQFQVAFKKI